MARRRSDRRGAPRTEASEWIGGRLSPPFFVEDGGVPHRVEMVLWLERPSGLVVGQDLLAPGDEVEGALGRVLLRALEAPLAGAPRRPAAIRVADPVLAAEVRAASGHDIPVTVAPTPELDALLEGMLEAMPESDVESYLEGGRISPEVVGKLFRAAEILYRAAPWKVASDDRVLRMDIPALGVEGACVSIIGTLGESLGLLVFPSLPGYDAFLRAAQRADRKPASFDFGTDWLALDFVRGSELPASLRREVASHGWPVAGANAYPHVTRHDRDGAPRPRVERDLAIAAAAAVSLTAFFLKHRRLFEVAEPEPVCESWFDENDLEVRFTLPYEAFPRFQIERRVEVAPAPSPGERPQPSRNAPCPCGSGRKYKKCCLQRDEPAPSAGESALDLDQRLLNALGDFAERRVGAEWRRSAADFTGEAPAILQLAVPWALYHCRIEGRTILERYLAERGARLSSAERACLAAQQDAWLSVWEVTAVEPGQGLALCDLLSGETRALQERTASRSLVLRDAVLGRVVDFDGVSLICGLHPHSLPPAATAEVVRRARARLRRKGPVPVERLRDESFGRALIRRWDEAVAERGARSPAPRELRNTDGDVFLLTTDHFEIEPGAREEVEALLAALPDVEIPDAADEPPAYVFLRRGNRIHKSWDNTVVGTARLSGPTLRVETNSRERADALRKRLERACGDRIHHRTREHADPLSDAAPRPRLQPVPEPTPPEAEQLAREFLERYYTDWLDQPVPALRGKTPREAARTARGRAAVDLLLKEFENRAARSPSDARFDFSTLRRALRLDEGGES